MAVLPWFRMYHEARTDAKLRTLDDSEFRVWFNLLCHSAEHKVRGTIDAPRDGFLLSIEVANGDEELLRRVLQKLERLQIVEWNILDDGEEGDLLTFTHFNDRNYDKPSDQPASVSARVKKHRNARVTPEKRDVTPRNALEENRVEESRGEKEEKKTIHSAGLDKSFRQFWSSYPRREAKINAQKAWEKIDPDMETVTRIINDVEARGRSEQWKKNGGQFIPLPATYLNGRRWEDETAGGRIVPQKPEGDHYRYWLFDDEPDVWRWRPPEYFGMTEEQVAAMEQSQ